MSSVWRVTWVVDQIESEMALYFRTHPDRHEEWGRALDSGLDRIVRSQDSGRCSFETLYSASYNLCIHEHTDVLWAVMTKWAEYVAKHLNGEYLKTRRQQCVEMVDDIFLYSNKHVFKKSYTTALLFTNQKIKARRCMNLKRWKRAILLLGKVAALYKRAVERVYAPGGKGAMEAGEHFKSVASAEKPSPDKKRKREESAILE